MNYANVNVNLIIENVIQIEKGITINVEMSAKIQKNIVYAKNIVTRVLLHVLSKIANI